MALETPLADDIANRMSIDLGNIITPATAVTDKDIFCGRMTQVEQVCDAINQVGLHAIVYGERGVGKTSLAKFLASNLSAPGRTLIAPHVNCDSGDDFVSVWRKSAQ